MEPSDFSTNPQSPGTGKLPWQRITVWCAGVLTILFIAWCLWIDKQVRDSFSALQWALPARIYARPLELYANASIQPVQLADTLQRLGYRRTDAVNGPGEFAQAGQTIELHSRGFQFWDGTEPPAHIQVNFEDDHVLQLLDNTGNELGLVRLEPVEIAQINPETGEDRLPLRLEDVPDYLVQAVVAVEDQRFFEHHGVDPIGIARALVANLRAGGIVQGGSTLTQQLVKNLYLHRDQTLRRKIEEALMAVALDLRFSKQQILEAYLNEVFLAQEGSRAIHGFALGAQYYFGRSLAQLELHELALLAGLPRGPSLYNPRRNPERALDRRNTVLARMADAGFISREHADRAMEAPLELSARPEQRGSGYPAFMDLVRTDLTRDYDAEALQTAGLRIFTTLDTHLQDSLQRTLPAAITAVQRRDTTLQAAVIITDVNNADVRAIAGDHLAGYTGFNRALQARRPIGSLIKPAVYLTALEQGGFSLASVLDDDDVEIELDNGDTWTPRNFENRKWGNIYLHEALEKSLNLATVNLGMQLGVPQALAMLQRLGGPEGLTPYPSALLGAVEMTPLEVAQMYQTLAAGGFYSPLRAVEAITTGTGEQLQRYGYSTRQVADPINIYLLEYMMQGVFYRGTARSAAEDLGRHLPLAGKTGTTNDLRDSWFAGYGGNLTGVVWLGHDDNSDTGLTGSTGALQVWSQLMLAMNIAPRDTPAPAGVQWQRVASQAVDRADQRNCQDNKQLPFHPEYPASETVSCEQNESLIERVIDRVRTLRP